MKQDDDLCKSIVQQILQKSTEMRRIIVPIEGQGGVTLSRVSPQCHRYRLQITSGGSRWGTVTAVKGENNAAGAARYAAAASVGRTRTESVIRTVRAPARRR